MAGQNYYPGQYKFQCLHGMGESLYEHITGPVAQGKLNRPRRIYAPVGTHETLLAYLVRRLLENGANTSFVNRIGDPAVPVDDLIADPVEAARKIQPIGAPHRKIALPRDLFGTGRPNSSGLDLTNEQRLASLSAALLAGVEQPCRAAPLLGEGDPDGCGQEGAGREVRNPADTRDVVGTVVAATAEQVDQALAQRSEEHTAKLQSLNRISYACLCLINKPKQIKSQRQQL